MDAEGAQSACDVGIIKRATKRAAEESSPCFSRRPEEAGRWDGMHGEHDASFPAGLLVGSAPSFPSGPELSGVFSLFLFSAHSTKDKYCSSVQGLRTFYQCLLNSVMEKVVVAKVCV